MTSIRPHPFDLIFPSDLRDRFTPIHAALGDDDARARFLMVVPAIELLRDLRPDEGLGDTTDDFVALVHSAYRFWRDGQHTDELDGRTTRNLLAGDPITSPIGGGGSRYIQVAPRLIWAQIVPDGPFEPLDGWFVTSTADVLDMVACFGVHPDRPGITVINVSGPRPEVGTRPDGTPPFAPTMTSGDLAGLFAVGTTDELLLLGWRAAPGEADH